MIMIFGFDSSNKFACLDIGGSKDSQIELKEFLVKLAKEINTESGY